MREEIAFENGRISDFQGLVTSTFNRVNHNINNDDNDKRSQYQSAKQTVDIERVVNSWNFPDSVDFSSLPRFKRAINKVDFSQFLKCF